MNSCRAVVQIAKLASSRQLSTTVVRRGTQDVHPGYKKTWSKYAHFQKDDGIPVHLKNGLADKALYGFTIFFCGIGLLGCADFIYTAAYPKKN